MRRRSHSHKAPKETGLQKLFTFDSNGRNGSRHFRRTLHSCMISLPSGRGRPVPPSGRPALIPHFPRSLRWRNVHVVEVARASGAGPAVPRDEARYEIVVRLQCIRIARYAAAQEIVVQVEAHSRCIWVYLYAGGVPGAKGECANTGFILPN